MLFRSARNDGAASDFEVKGRTLMRRRSICCRWKPATRCCWGRRGGSVGEIGKALDRHAAALDMRVPTLDLLPLEAGDVLLLGPARRISR